VRMRRRKPWVFARRRLLGWNVRLLTRGLPVVTVVRGTARCLVDGASRLEARHPGGAGRPQRPSATGPGNGTGAHGPWSNAPHPRPAGARPAIVAGHTRQTGADTPGGWRDQVQGADDLYRGLWTTACWHRHRVVSVPRVAGPFPSRRTALHRCHRTDPGRRTGHTGATYVHRLWTTVWTATGGTIT
jgi:hypothetical protein